MQPGTGIALDIDGQSARRRRALVHRPRAVRAQLLLGPASGTTFDTPCVQAFDDTFVTATD